MIDVDDTIREVHGYQKQGAAFGGVNLGVETPVVVFDEPTANLAGQRTPTPAMYPAA